MKNPQDVLEARLLANLGDAIIAYQNALSIHGKVWRLDQLEDLKFAGPLGYVYVTVRHPTTK